MRLTIAQPILSRALASAGRCIGKHSSLPALSAVLLDARAGLALTTTDLDRTLRLDLEAEVEDPGRVLVPARLLAEVVSGLPAGDVTLAASDAKRITVESGGYKLGVLTLDPDEFPPTPALAEPAGLTLLAAMLKSAIGQVRHAVAEDAPRPALTGVSFRADGQTLTLAAADGFRLAVKTLPARTDKPFTAIVPAGAVDEMARLLGGGDARIEVGSTLANADPTHCVLVVQAAQLTCRLIEGNFPNYQQIIPTALDNSLSCAVGDLRQALRVASPITRAASLIVKLVFDSGGIEVTAEAADTGNVRAHVEATVATGPGTLVLNATYLADALAAVGTERVELAWQGSGRPVRVVGVGDESLVQVVMPIHTPAEGSK